MNRPVVTLLWLAYTAMTVFAIVAGRGGGGSLSGLVVVWLDQLPFFLGFEALLTFLLVVGWATARRR